MDQINKAADELNNALHSKYALIRTAKGKMTDIIRISIRVYNEQELTETKGMSCVQFLLN